MRNLDNSSFTLVELLVTIMISSIIGATVVLMLTSSLETWRFGEAQLSIDKVNQEILERIVEGTFELEGLRDAMEIYKASSNEIIFVPLQKDLHILEKSLSKGDKIFLKRQFKAGTNDPLVEAKLPGASEFRKINSIFYYGEKTDPDKIDDYIVVKESLPVGSELRLIYHPEPKDDPWIRIRYFWDAGERKLYHTHQGITVEIPPRNPDVKIERIEFLYFANANAPILSSTVESGLSSSQLKRITAVKVIVVSEKGQERREATSFVNIRNLSNRGAGIIITEGSKIEIPDSDNIKALSLVNIDGAHQDDEIVIEISSKMGKTWRITIEFGLPPEDLESQEMRVKSYQIEYPKGKVVLSEEVYSSLARGVSFLNLGNDLYDYDNDPNIKDVVYYKGEVQLKVLKMDVDAAAIAVQP